MLREVAIDVFDYDHRAVHDHADGDGEPAQRHEVRRQADLAHHDEGGQRGQHQSAGDDQRAANVAQEEEKHHDDEHHPFGQRLVHRAQCGGDQFDPVVERHDAQPVRQQMPAMNVVDAGLDPLDDLAGIAAPEHQDDPAHDFAFAVQDGGAMPDRVIDQDLRHIADEDRGSSDFLDDDPFDVLKRPDEPEAPHDVFLGVFFQDIAAGVGIVAGNGVEHLAEGEVVFPQHRGFDQNLVLFDEPAHGIDVDHFRRALQ